VLAGEEGGEAKDDNDDADDDVWQEAVASTEQPPVLLVVLMQLGKPYACVVCGGVCGVNAMEMGSPVRVTTRLAA
jgi:hypothetical protein